MSYQNNVTLDCGQLYLIDRTPTPDAIQIGARLEGVDVSFEATTKAVKGGGVFDDIVAVTGRKASLKVKKVTWNGLQAAKAHGGTATTGMARPLTESPTLTDHTQTLTHTPIDVVRVLSASGAEMVEVASSPALNVSYTRSAGVLTYHADQTACSISYTYTDSSNGNTITVSQQAVAAVPTFEVYAFNEFTDLVGTVHKVGFHFYSVYAKKDGLSLKEKDFGGADQEFEALPDPTHLDASGNAKVYEMYYG